MNKKNIPKYFINILKWPVDNADAFFNRFAFFAEAIGCLQWFYQRIFFRDGSIQWNDRIHFHRESQRKIRLLHVLKSMGKEWEFIVGHSRNGKAAG